MIEEKEYLYWLCQIPVLGAVTIRNLWERFGSLSELYNIEEKQLIETGLLREKAARALVSFKSRFKECQKEYYSLPKRGVRFITPLDPDYPKRLLQIYDYPMGLYVKGRLPDENRPTAAVIGARNCSSYGSQIAEHLAAMLAEEGVQVISGLALGIDGAGHRGALRGNHDTYGVLGCGIHQCYPRENYSLYEQMIVQGGVMTECRLSEAPAARNFPMRNRIISGLSDILAVVEARQKSGSLITVELALEQGKEIFAVPGRITDPLSSGCNQLIRDGANLLVSPYDMIEYLGIKIEKKQKVCEKNEKGLVKKEKMVYSCLDLKPKFLEEIIMETGLPVSECMGVLVDLELKGYIIETANHYYVKKLDV